MICFDSRLGWNAVWGWNGVVHGVVTGSPTEPRVRAIANSQVNPPSEARNSRQPRWLRRVADNLRWFLDGDPVDFSQFSVEISHLTTFQQTVLTAVRRVGYGETASYGEVAAAVRRPRAARAVGNAVRRNPASIIIPCHRVVSSTGIGGFGRREGIAMKKRLLQLEGHTDDELQ